MGLGFRVEGLGLQVDGRVINDWKEWLGSVGPIHQRSGRRRRPYQCKSCFEWCHVTVSGVIQLVHHLIDA